jgi:hypothetical protein
VDGDEDDRPWLSDLAATALVRFDPSTSWRRSC